MTRIRRLVASVLATAAGFVAVMVVSLVFLQPQQVNAGSEIGGTGPPGGCSSNCDGAPYTSNGYGWYKFGIDSGGPGDFKGGSTWSWVRQRCIDSGNDLVIAFIIERPTGGPSNARVYNYESGEYGTYYQYKGNNGGNWLTYGQAYSRFSEITDKGGYVWGSNVAWFCHSDIKWRIQTFATVVGGVTNAAPNDTISWNHTVKNNGGETTNRNVSWRYQNRQGLGSGVGTSWLFAQPKANQVTAQEQSSYRVVADDVDRQLCRSTTASPQNNIDNNWIESSQACVYIPYNYTLNPTVTVNQRVASPVTRVPNIQGHIANEGPTMSRPNTIWQLTYHVYGPGATIPSAPATSPTAPCGTSGDYNGRHFGLTPTTNTPTAGQCLSLERGGGGTSGSVRVEGRNTNTYTVEVADLALGSRICFSLSVKSYRHDNANWRHSVPACIPVGKAPKMQVLGGDLWVGRSTTTSNISTSFTQIIERSAIQPPYNPNMISGFWQTGVDNNGNKLGPGVSDPHWRLSGVTSASSQYPHCQQGTFPRAATVVNTDTVTVGGNEAWKANIPQAGWIGANSMATNDNIGANNCPFPAMSQNINAATFARAPTWTFELTNGFYVDQCVNPSSIRINMRIAADDEVSFLINGRVIKNFHQDTPVFNTWPQWQGEQSLTSVTLGPNLPSGTFRTDGSRNSFEIKVKSAWQYTGLLVARNISVTASCNSVTPGNVFGSYAEYGLLASGTIRGAASGSGYAGRISGNTFVRGASTTDLCRLSVLTLNNYNADGTSCNASSIGGYNKLPALAPQIGARFQTNDDTPEVAGTVTLSDVNSGVYKARDTNTIYLSATQIPRGKWIVLNVPDNNVRITGNIDYTPEALHSMEEIPQVIIIANNITIDPSVTKVDSWLVAVGTGANGYVNTCRLDNVSETDLGVGLNANTCNAQLNINGPVIANHLYLRRTYGSFSADQSGVPAEVFNLRPDAYLWGLYRAGMNGQLPTITTQELPPRY